MQETIRCVELVEVVTEWMEGALDDDRRATVEDHLAICPDCTGYLDQLRTIAAITARLAEPESAEQVPDDVRARLLVVYRASRPG